MITNLLRFTFASFLAMMCVQIHAQEADTVTSTFRYTATEKIDRFKDEGFAKLFVGATAIISHTYFLN